VRRYFCEPHHNFGGSTEIAAEHRHTSPPDRPLFFQAGRLSHQQNPVKLQKLK